MTRTDITVLFATRNGQAVLPRTLEAYCGLELSPRRWKMVVVDNGSDDTTLSILHSYQQRLPLEIFNQPIAGKNRALNLGLNAIEGQLAIITDDDAIPNSTFLTAWSKYLDRELDYELFGGSIAALFDIPPPKWLLNNQTYLEILFAVRDLPEGPIAADLIYGPNMAVRTSVFRAGLRFNEGIGPNGSDPDYPMGSETEFCRRVEQSGAKAWFAKDPAVLHIVRTSQISRSYWAKRFYRHGRGVAQRIWDSGQDPPAYLLRPFMINQVWRLYNRLRMLSPSPSQRFNSFFAYHWRRGFCDEWAKRK